MPRHRFKARQRLHFFFSVVLPTMMLAALFCLHGRALFNWPGLILWGAMWFMTGCVGISVGYHRYFSHRAFVASSSLKKVLGICGCTAVQGSITYWVAIHRHHHTMSDLPGDIHSPRLEAQGLNCALRAFLRGHIAWVLAHDVPLPQRYCGHLVNDPDVAWVDQRYWLWVVLGYAAPTLLGFTLYGNAYGAAWGIAWGGCVRVLAGHNVIWSINSFCHTFGRRDHNTPDHSRNLGLLSVISFGESWHNNHHKDPDNPKFSTRPGQCDIGWLSIRLMQRAGWLRLPDKPTH